MPATIQVNYEDYKAKETRLKQLEQRIEDLEEKVAELDDENRDLRHELKDQQIEHRKEQEPVEELIALRDKELAMPGSVLNCEWRRAWKKIGANG